MRAPWLVDVAREVGVPFVDMAGRVGRGRDMASIDAIVWHETVTPLTTTAKRVAELLRDGRPGLAGPLAQIGPDRAGTIWLPADGRCNHNGFGRYGNNTIALEFFGPGDGTRLTDVQYDAGLRMTAGTLRRAGLGLDRLVDHKTTDPARKIDLVGVRLDNVRAACALHMLAQAGWPPARPAAPTSARTSHTMIRRGLRLNHLRRSLMKVKVVHPLDEFGRGWLPLDGRDGRPLVRDDELLAVIPQGSHPGRDRAYWPIPEVGQNSEGTTAVLTIEGGIPSGTATLFLTVPDAA